MQFSRQDAIDTVARYAREDSGSASSYVCEFVAASYKLGGACTREDADQSVLFARETEVEIAAETLREFPELPLADGNMLSLDTIPDGATHYYWHVATTRGLVKWADGCDSEIPWTSIGRVEQTGRTRNLVGGYKWCLEDQRKASFAGVTLVPWLREGSARAHTRKWDETIAWGKEELGLVGLFNHPNSTVIAAPLNAAQDSTLWTQKTADEILADVNLLVHSIKRATNEMRMATDVIWSPRMDDYVRTTRIGGIDSDFIFELIQRAHTGITFTAMRYMDASNPRSQGKLPTGDAMFAFNRGSDFVTKVRSFLFRTVSPQAVGLEIRVPAESKIGGVKVKEPLTMALMRGLFT